MAWFYTVLLAGCSVGIVAVGAVMTHRIFRDETLSRTESAPSSPTTAPPTAATTAVDAR